LPLIVEENEPIAIDRDEVFLIEDWHLQPDGRAATAGSEASDLSPVYTVNGRLLPDISVQSRERLRLRFINGCERQVIAVKIDTFEVRVIAIDGAPAEPFVARSSALVLAPGGRTDALIDVTAGPGTASAIRLHDGREARLLAKLAISTEPPIRPAPLPAAAALAPDGLPVRLDLAHALRAELPLQGGEWVRAADFPAPARPAFRARAGKVVVLALNNPTEHPACFHLHGHHFRLLDRLDDGWKPFWLDTLMVEPGRTERIAFAAEFSGRWLLESAAARWAAPRLLRWYIVD
jgi:FtsP/CotA-like multicopper oxidase with cupredoxin domain